MFTILKTQKINARWFTTRIGEKPTENKKPQGFSQTCIHQNPHAWS
jgi:hypothetical protein